MDEKKTRPTILVVDDVSENKEVLRNILQNEYKIIEVCDVEEAKKTVVEVFSALTLILLNINISKSNEMDFLQWMNDMYYVDKFSMIVYSSEISAELKEKAYKLRAIDFFQIPFDEKDVLYKIRSTVSLRQKTTGVYKDAIGMLSNIFYRIVKMNLTTYTSEVIKAGRDKKILEATEDVGVPMDINKYANINAEFVHEEDRKEYIDFMNHDRLKTFFDSGQTYTYIHYRRLIENEYRWISVELLRSTEYTLENQVIMMYVRDINDDYLKQLNLAMRRSTDSIGVFSFNVTKGICMAGNSQYSSLELADTHESMDGYLKRVADMIPLNGKKAEFYNAFNGDNLVNNFAKGETALILYAPFVLESKQSRLLKINMELTRNTYSKDIEGIMYFTDSTENYLKERIPSLLYEANYEEICVIDLNENTISISGDIEKIFTDYNKNIFDYDVYMKGELKKRSLPDEYDLFCKYTEIDTIVKQLELNGKYTFVVHHMTENNSVTLKKYRYMYLNKEMGKILSAYEDVTELTERDILTGGLNRQGFIRNVEEILKSNLNDDQLAIIYFNIKNFKAINEMFGVQDGDSLLRNIYQDFCSSDLSPILVSRLEADHFALLIRRECIDFAYLNQICERSYKKGSKSLRILARCGIYYIKDKSVRIEGMLDRAKLAKTYIMDEYVKRYAIYDDTMKNAYIDRAEITGEVDASIENEEFLVYLQPVIDVNTEKLVSCEALIRWKHPQKGMISPGLFIPTLEKDGSITKLDTYVLVKVYEFLKKRIEAGEEVVPISVNLSWMDFYDVDMFKWLMSSLRKDEIARKYIRFEITETSFAAIAENHSMELDALKNSGVKILLDDFGSGYSSFGMLQDYSFDILKLDMAFVRQITTNAKTKSIIHGIIDMAHQMDIKIIAEGAEELEQIDFLKRHGCDYIQGYYYSKPLSMEEFVSRYFN